MGLRPSDRKVVGYWDQECRKESEGEPSQKVEHDAAVNAPIDNERTETLTANLQVVN